MKTDEKTPNLRHLRMFMSTCELGSINAAAGAMHVAQPAITQAIAKLEIHFGAALLSRHREGSLPTPAGQILHSRCERFFRQIHAAIMQAPERAAAPGAQLAATLAGRLTVSQIAALIGVANHGSLWLAAHHEGVSVSAMHRAAKEIENNLGYAVFSKARNRLNVNHSGAELARRLQIALREIAIAEEEIRSLSGQPDGKILIGTLPMIRSSLLGLAINRTLIQAPGLRFEVQEGVYATMLKALRNGEIDLLIGALRRPSPANDVHERLLFTDPYAIIARKGHPLDGHAAQAAELLQYEWVVQKPGTPVRAALESIFIGTNLAPRVAVETSSLSLTRSILLDSDRLAILSRRQITIEERAGLLTALPISIASTGRRIGLSTRQDWHPSNSHLIFLENFYSVLIENVGPLEE
ncbi:LysR family transcriptional regulator [Kerstersia similis]|uniref:LysR family transcriptional regulator n=1 Tax=Kerstersia similis TaxID=206505 RepID=UPI0039EF5119